MEKRIGVVQLGEAHGLAATQCIDVGELLFRIDGEPTSQPTRYSVQVGPENHIDLPPTLSAEVLFDAFYWRYMNHHCEPNAMIQDREVYALRTIYPEEAITFNYNTTEAEMAEPFLCHCESSRCKGLIQGFKHLSSTDQQHLLPLLAPHLLPLLKAIPNACAENDGENG